MNNNNEKQIIKPIAQKLTETQKRWGITEKEMYAVIWAIKKLDIYLSGRKFKIITDHKASTWIKSKQDFGNPRIQRWLDDMQHYDFIIEYRKGETMMESDALSRSFENNKCEKNCSTEQEKIIKEIHENTGHRGVDVIEYEIVKNYTRWPGIQNHIKGVIKNCIICSKNKVKSKGGSIYVQTSRKMEKLGLDILEHNETYILLAIDYFTRFAWGSVLKTKNSKEIYERLNLLFKKNGNPEELVCDAGLEFNNQLIEELCLRRNIKRHIISIDNHKSNGRVERLNRTIRQYFRKNECNIKLEELLGRSLDQYNNSYHSVISMSPSEAWNNNENVTLKGKNSDKCPYAKNFKKKYRDKFIKGQIVNVKELPKHKENQIFGKTRKIIEKVGNDSYLVKSKDKIEKRSHVDLNLLPLRSE